MVGTIRDFTLDRMNWYTTESLGATQSLTPEGFLLCRDVPLARTGTLIYADGEVPVDAGNDGLIYVSRDADDVFDPVAIASFAGKPVTNDHPPVKVTPSNWSKYAVGVVLNPRRGDGVQFDSNFLYADLQIHDADAIKAIRDGKREVSAGYDSSYEQIAAGRGRQSEIVGNHVALVEKGRCGPRCAIGDEDMAARKVSFKDRILRAVRNNDEDALVDELDKVEGMMFGANDEAPDPHHVVINVHGSGTGASAAPPKPVKDEVEAGAEDPPGNAGESNGGGSDMQKLMSMVQEFGERLGIVEQSLAILAGEEGTDDPENAEEDPDVDPDNPDPDDDDVAEKTRDEAAEIEGVRTNEEGLPSEIANPKEGPKGSVDRARGRGRTGDSGHARALVGDSSKMGAAFQDMLARAEILSPGIRMPTFDAKKTATSTFDAMCSFKRQTLEAAWRDERSRQAIEPLLEGGYTSFTDRRMMSCDAVSLVFKGASEVLRRENNQRMRPQGGQAHGGAAFGQRASIADINKRNRDEWARRTGTSH